MRLELEQELIPKGVVKHFKLPIEGDVVYVREDPKVNLLIRLLLNWDERLCMHCIECDMACRNKKSNQNYPIASERLHPEVFNNVDNIVKL